MVFEEILRAVLTPVALISGLGLLLLSQVNRFNQALARLRELLRIEHEGRAHDQVDILHKRCRTLQQSIAAMVTALLGIVVLIFLLALDAAGLPDPDWLKLYLLLFIFAAVVLSLVLFLFDIRYSLAAIRSEMHYQRSGEAHEEESGSQGRNQDADRQHREDPIF